MLQVPQNCIGISVCLVSCVALFLRNEGSDKRKAMVAVGIATVLLMDLLRDRCECASKLIWPAVYFSIVSNVIGYLVSEAPRRGKQMAQLLIVMTVGLSVLDVTTHAFPLQSEWPELSPTRLGFCLSLIGLSTVFSYQYINSSEVATFILIQLLLVVAALVLSTRTNSDFTKSFFDLAIIYPIGSVLCHYTNKKFRQIFAIVCLMSLSGMAVFQTYNEFQMGLQGKSALRCCLWTCLLFATGALVTSTLSGHVGQVDKLWTIMPVMYSLIALSHFPTDNRIRLMCFCMVLWSSKLTYNFYLRDGFPSNPLKFWGGEIDYRWPIIRSKFTFLQNPVVWFLFNFFIITIYQMTLILCFSLPIVFCADEVRDVPLGKWDYFCTCCMLFFITLEHIADEQHQVFQVVKHSDKATAVHKVGFFTSKLFSVVRHPNYASEQCIWFSCFLFTLPHAPYLNWASPGCLFLAQLFLGSSTLSEGITTSKYPHYVEFQKKLPRFYPGL